MPLKLVPPRPGRSPNYTLRGTETYGDQSEYVDETTGTSNEKLAKERLKQRREEVIASLVQRERDKRQGRHQSRPFADAAVAYIGSEKPTGTQLEAIVGYERSDGTLSPNLVDDLGAILVCDITQANVDEITQKRFGHCQPNTIVRQLITPLTAVLNFAAQPGREWCKAPAFIRPEYDDERRRHASYDEADRLLQAAVSPSLRVARDIQEWQRVYLRTLLLFFMLTGARMSEALKLRWEDVNIQGRWLVFRSTKRNKKPRTRRAMLRADDRGGEDRGVPIHPQLQIALANLPGDPKTGQVFLTRRGRGYAINVHGRGQIKKAWAGVCQRAGIADLTPHDLRRSCASWLTAAFVHEQVRDEIIGHKVSSMGRRYAQVPNPDHIAAIDKLPRRKLDVDEAPAAASRGKSVELA